LNSGDDSTSGRLTAAGFTSSEDIILTGAGTQQITRDANSRSLLIAGGTAYSDGAYFQITGLGYSTGGPGYGSAEFVIRNVYDANANLRSKFALYSTDGSTWTPRFMLWGDTGEIEIGGATIDSDGNAVFDGRISSGQTTITTSSDTTDVSGINTLFVDTTSADVILGGLVGGVDGQTLLIVKIVAVNDLTLQHEEGIGGDTDDFFMHQLADEIIDSGGVTLVFNGTTEKWYDCSHAKHV